MSSDHSQHRVPSYTELMNPALSALRALGGSGTIHDMLDQVIQDMNLSARVSSFRHTDGRQSRVSYQLAWARSYLKRAGLIENHKRGVWSLTNLGQRTEFVDPREVVDKMRNSRRRGTSQPAIAEPDYDYLDSIRNWQGELLEVLRGLEPDAFERLCRQILMESGFIEVVVSGRTGDGGIDGNGIIRLADLISFPVLFQCKRYAKSVGAPTVRDFRGAMQGRADKGLILTTGEFTAEANREATRDGAPPIDLIDGKLLVNKIKELGLGVTTRTVEVVEVDAGWFESI